MQEPTRFWQFTDRTYIHTTFNLTEAHEIVADLYNDAKVFEKRYSNSFEIEHVEILAARLARTLRMALDAAKDKKNRVTRNILGDFVHGLTGLATDEEIEVEHRQIVEVRDRLRVLADKEVTLYKTVADLADQISTLEGLKRVIAQTKHVVIMDALYATKKEICALKSNNKLSK